MVETVLKNLEKWAEWNKLNSLDIHEKQELQNLSVEAIQKQKVSLGNETFNVWGKNMKLSDIVKNFDTATGTVNGVKVEKRSDLAAAIQVFVLANWKHISVNPIAANNEAKWIDWIVWTNTKSWIDAYKNSVNVVKVKVERAPFERCTVKGLETYPFAKVFDSIVNGKSKELKKMKVLDQDWCLKKYKHRIEDNKAHIHYISNIDGEQHKIVFNIKKDSSWEVDVLQFAKDIVTKINNAEKTTAGEKVEDSTINSIESFDVRKFSKKAQAYLKEKDYLFGNKLDFKSGLWTWIIFDDKWNLKLGNLITISKKDMDSYYVNWVFNSEKLRFFLGNILNKKADEYFKEKIHNEVASLNKTRIVEDSIYNESQRMNWVEARFRYVKGIDVSINADDQRDFDKRKIQLENMRVYKNASKWTEQKLKDLVKEWEGSKGESYTQSVDALRRFSRLLNEHKLGWEWKNVYTIYNSIPNGAQKYEDLRKRAQAAADRTRQKEK